MSAQGGTLARRGTMHLPVWPVAVAVVAIVGAAIGLAVLRGLVDAPAPVREQGAVLNTAAVEASAAAIREQGAGLRQGVWGVSHVAPSRPTFAIGLENPGAYGISQVTEGSFPIGLENPGAYGISRVAEGTFPIGLENPGAYPSELGGSRAEAHRPSVVNGEICGQCR
jgi:hypothetical protein